MKKTIYLAGGCFWGLEKYLSYIQGVLTTEVGYANGKTEYPTYRQVCDEDTGHAETVKVEYDSEQIDLSFILQLFFEVIDPTSLNKQGNDIGTQYRTGIYYTDSNDLIAIQKALEELQEEYQKPIVVEVLPLLNYYPAEEYHQDYLDKNPTGYCHIGTDEFERAKKARYTRFKKKTQEQLQKELTGLEFEVTQNSATEPAFQNEYYDEFREGIYVDKTTGEPLFVSTDKFESGCGWPSFSKPIQKNLIREYSDSTFNMKRTEVRSTLGDAHLGHVFEDGPKETGGLRYCINSAALKFIPKEKMIQEGYQDYLIYLK